MKEKVPGDWGSLRGAEGGGERCRHGRLGTWEGSGMEGTRDQNPQTRDPPETHQAAAAAESAPPSSPWVASNAISSVSFLVSRAKIRFEASVCVRTGGRG